MKHLYHPFSLSNEPASILHGSELVLRFLSDVAGSGALSSDGPIDGIMDASAQGLALILDAVVNNLAAAQQIIARDFEPKNNHGSKARQLRFKSQDGERVPVGRLNLFKTN